MSAFWDSDRMTSRLAAVLGRVAHTLGRRLAGPMLVALVAAGAWIAIAGDAQAARRLRTFDHDTVRRHITVLALTPTRLVVAHAAPNSATSFTKPFWDYWTRESLPSLTPAEHSVGGREDGTG